MLYKRFIWLIKISFPDCPGHVWPEKLIEAGGAMQKLPLNSIWSWKKSDNYISGKISVQDNVNHMNLQSTCLRVAKVTLVVEFIWFPCCVFSNVASSVASERIDKHTGYIYMAFLHCAVSCVFSKFLNEKMHNHTACICLAFLHCAVSCV